MKPGKSKELVSAVQGDVKVLARGLLQRRLGDQLYLNQLQEELGQGAVEAFKLLESQGMVGVEGNAISHLNYSQLWGKTGWGTVMALMPLPFSRRFEGLATGLHQAFQDAGIPLRLGFIRGATRRVDALLEGRCDLIVSTKMTIRLDMEMGRPLSFLHIWGFQSYVKEHVVVFRDPRARKIRRGMRVALDPVSVDQTILTSHECEGIDVKFVDSSYARTFEMLENGKVDAVVWSLDELDQLDLDYNYQSLSDRPHRVVGEDTVSALAVSRDEAELGGVLQLLVDFAQVESIQQRVVRGEIKPWY